MPSLTTNISGGFATMFKKAEEMLNAASEYCEELSTTVGQNVITVGQSVIGQNAIESLDDINWLKPLIVEHFCNETIELPKNDQFYEFHKVLCVQLKEEDKSIKEAVEYMWKTMEDTFNAIDPTKIDELIKEIQNSDSLSAVNKKVFVSLLGQFKLAIDRLQIIDAKKCCRCAVAPNSRNIFGNRGRRYKRNCVCCSEGKWYHGALIGIGTFFALFSCLIKVEMYFKIGFSVGISLIALGCILPLIMKCIKSLPL